MNLISGASSVDTKCISLYEISPGAVKPVVMSTVRDSLCNCRDARAQHCELIIVLPPAGLNNITGNFNTSRPLDSGKSPDGRDKFSFDFHQTSTLDPLVQRVVESELGREVGKLEEEHGKDTANVRDV